jgi:CBS domain-containing protein
MSTDPICLDANSTAADAALVMREHDIGPVIVTDGDQTAGIVTDRDIVVRVIADDKDPASTPLAEICSAELAVLDPESPLEEAIGLMRSRAVRRLPVVDDGRAVGILSIGDLAIERQEHSALADISRAEPNE